VTRGKRRWLLAGLGLVLAAVLVVVAHPGAILRMAGRAHPSELGVALAITAVITVLRGLRLRLVVGSGLGTPVAVGTVAVTQLFTSLLPLRLGELALLPLLHRAGVAGALRGLSFIVTVRLFDLAALLSWAVVAGVWVGVRGRTAGILLVALLAGAAVAFAAGQQLVRALARRWRRAGGIRRRALRQLLRVRAELLRLARDPGRAAAALGVSLAVWGGVWAVTVALLRAMDLPWPASTALWGLLGATAGAAAPVNAAGSFGTLEAGWTAALATLGVPATAALRAGFATHAWSLVFTILLGALGAALLLLHPGSAASSFRANARSGRSTSTRRP
jgi:uncharacterized membrane protein YbhN (UPF0104 family)